MAVEHPEWISALIVQNVNAYSEGLGSGFKKIMTMEDVGDKAEVENILKSIISSEGIKVQNKPRVQLSPLISIPMLI